MFDHVSIGVRDLAPDNFTMQRSARSVTLSQRGSGRIGLWARQDRPLDWQGCAPVPPDPGSNLHFCFAALRREAVDAFHAAALGAGGTDNGAPGLRPDYGADYYAAFAVDPDGYRIEAYCGG